MKSLYAVVLAAVAALGITNVRALAYTAVQAEKSTLTFVSRQMGVPINGRFPKFSAQVSFDPARPDAGKVSISIDLVSIDAGSRDANDEVVGKLWFNAGAYPTATFVSSGIKSLGGGNYEVAGSLTIKGKAQAMTAPFSFRSEGNSGIFEGGFVVKRIDFAIGEGPWADVSMVADNVQVNFRVLVAAPSSVATPAAAKAAVPIRPK
jgi:polyisoprenoid-binding protein YceI